MDTSRASVNLKHRIENLRRTNTNGTTYIPLFLLLYTIDYDSVLDELAKANIDAYHRDEIATEVTQGGKKIFAILVLIQKVGLVKSIMGRDQMRDSCLPFGSWDLRYLNSKEASSIFDAQWEFLAPQFSRGTINRRFESEIPLPFVRDERIKDGKGAFGTVYEVELDEQHQRSEANFCKSLARKEFDSSENHAVELKNLSILNHLKHPNILELLTSYNYNERNNLIFPFAEGGDLRKLLKTQRERTPFCSTESLLVALARLSSAIDCVHDFVDQNLDINFIGCHHDLRPRNILISKRTLFLADFGLSRFKRISEGSRTVTKMGNDDYLAPECEDIEKNFARSKIGRSSDIWSFGCILSEVWTYMALGPTGVERFHDNRRYTVNNWVLYHFHCGSQSNAAVQNWLSMLANIDAQRKVVLLPLIQNMLSINERDRPKANIVTACLQLAAISELSRRIEDLYSPICRLRDSLDALLEHFRFQAWAYGLGITDGDIEISRVAPPLAIRDFQAAVQILNEMRGCLESILDRPDKGLTISIRDLARHNDDLMSFLHDEQRARTRVHLASSVLESKLASPDESSLDQFDGHALGQRIRMLAALRSMTDLAATHAVQDGDSRQIDVALIKDRKPFGDHHLAMVAEPSDKRQVLIEWRPYGRKEGDDSVSKRLFERLNSLVETLQLKKPAEFRSLPCRGFFHDSARAAFGVVYDLPIKHSITSTSSSGPVTLQSFLYNAKGRLEKQPLLEKKFFLAKALSQAVLQFHMVKWLHKSLSSANIIFPNSSTVVSEIIQEPYIIGFNHSRPDEPSPFTEGTPSSDSDYQHPIYSGKGHGFKQEYDYYSVGILLLEIGLWTPVGHWTRSDSWKDLPAGGLKERLLARRVPFLGPCMGSLYQEAVRVCLTSEFGVDDSLTVGSEERSVMLRRRFQDLVVDRITSRTN